MGKPEKDVFCPSMLSERIWTKEELLEEYERIKNIPIRQDITLTPETLFNMFESVRKIS